MNDIVDVEVHQGERTANVDQGGQKYALPGDEEARQMQMTKAHTNKRRG
jgi:hypothetical protein